MITREVDYAIRTVLSLAKRGAGSVSVATADLAKETAVPFRFLRRIIRKLVEGGILASQRGNGGGVQLTRPPDAISLLAVIAAVDGRSTKLNLCTISHANCPRSGTCRVHYELLSLQNTLEGGLDQVTMTKLIEDGAPHNHTPYAVGEQPTAAT